VIEEYDKRADCENLIGESKREGLAAIPSFKFATNYAYFQVVMLAYNIWRSFKIIAEHSQTEPPRQGDKPECSLKGIMDNTIRIARLKLLFIAAKIPVHSGASKVKYSEHDSRVAGLFSFFEYRQTSSKDKAVVARRWMAMSPFGAPRHSADADFFLILLCMKILARRGAKSQDFN
jgi:hypothetical protein